MGTQPRAIPSLPSDRTLDDAVQALASRGDHVHVVEVVDAWAAQGAPSQEARLRCARSLFHLRLMDRATARVREVLDQDPTHREALLLQARIYVERGWPVKARQPLTTLRNQPDAAGPELDELWERAHADPVRPEVNARVIEREGDPAAQIALAESFLATGSFLRATGILERLRRVDPENPRVRELLWGLQPAAPGAEVNLGALVRTLVPMQPLRVTRAAEEPEHTESFRGMPGGLDEAGGPAEDQNFPRLFKQVAPAAAADDDPENTQSSAMAAPGELAGRADGEHTDGRILPSGPAAGGDTQIMLVLRPGEEGGRSHRRREGAEDPTRETFDLRAFQASMGMSAAGSDTNAGEVDVEPEEEERSEALRAPPREPAPEEDLLEEEDANLVVMTRQEKPAAESPPEADLARPIEVIEKHPVPLAPPPPPEDSLPEAQLDPVGDGPGAADGGATSWEPSPPPSAPRGSRWLIVGLGGFAFLALAAFVLIVAARFGVADLGGSVRDRLLTALGSADYETLRREEDTLLGQEQASGKGELRAALAEARLVLWTDFDGAPERLAYVRTVLDAPTGIDTHRLSMLRAALALAEVDERGAAAALGRETPLDDEERLLFAKIAAASGDEERALQHFSRMEAPTAPRYALARARVLADGGHNREATEIVGRVLALSPKHARANLAQVALELDPGRRAAAADFFLQGASGSPLPPRVEGEAHALRARAFVAMGAEGKARAAVAQGLARDGTNPDLLLLAADDLARQGQVSAALRELDTIVASRPGHAEAQAARVLCLLELDRVDEADTVVKQIRTAGLLPETTPVLQGLVTVVGRSTRPASPLDAAATAQPLGAWVAAVAAAQGHDADAFDLATKALTALDASSAPFERRLVPRAAALRVLVAPPAQAPSLADEVEAKWPADPVAHVYLGRYFEGAGRKALAAQHFDRAASLGAETGLALYEKGRFYADAGDALGRSAQAWKAYLGLAPSGTRAERARAGLGMP